MTTNLRAFGDELAVVLDRSTLAALGIREGSPLEITLGDGEVRIRPALDEHRARVLDSARRMMEIHDDTFRKLAR